MYTVNREEEKNIREVNTILSVDIDDDDSNNEAPDHDFSAHYDPEKINIIVKIHLNSDISVRSIH